MNLKRQNWIDVARGIGIILVIIGHCHRPDIILKLIQAFHMPFFFILSGYLFSLKDDSFISNTKKLARRYLKPYFVLGITNYFIWLFIKYLQTENLSKIIELGQRYLLGLIYSRGTWYWMPNCSPIWFLTAIFVACILFRIIIKQKASIQYILILLSLFGAFLLCRFEPFKLVWNIDSAIWAQPYMFLGYKIKQKEYISKITTSNIKTIVLTFVFLSIGLLAALFNPIDFVSMDSMICGNFILALVSSTSISIGILLFIKKYIPKCNVLEIFGRNTIYILGFNYLANFLTYQLWDVIFKGDNVPYEWIFQCIIQIIFLFYVSLFFDFNKRRKKELY